MEHFHHRLMAKGLSHGKAVLAMWAMAFSCSLVSIAAAFGKGDQLFAVFVFFGLGGFILLRYLGYFRFEFFGEGLSTLIEDRKSTKTVEQAIKEAELIVSSVTSLDQLEGCLEKAAEGMGFQEAKISFFYDSNRLGAELDNQDPKVGRSIQWQDPNQTGYFSRKAILCKVFDFRKELYLWKSRVHLYGWSRLTRRSRRSSVGTHS